MKDIVRGLLFVWAGVILFVSGLCAMMLPVAVLVEADALWMKALGVVGLILRAAYLPAVSSSGRMVPGSCRAQPYLIPPPLLPRARCRNK
jgi:uncharacterized membrane protein YeiB